MRDRKPSFSKSLSEQGLSLLHKGKKIQQYFKEKNWTSDCTVDVDHHHNHMLSFNNNDFETK